MERNLHGGLQTYLGKLLVAVADYPGMPALEIILQRGADRLIEGVDILRFQTLAIWRVGDKNSFRCIVGPFSYGFALYLHHVVDARRLHVLACDGDSLRRKVAAVDLIGKLTFLRIVVIYFFEKILIEVRPFLESEALAVDAGVDVGGYESGLDQECSRAAHRIHEIAVAAPACLHYDAGGEHFVDRRFSLLSAVATFGERLAA